MSPSEKATQYIEKHTQWSTSLSEIYKFLKNASLVEEIKWGAPLYSYNKNILIGLGAFKNHIGIWFHQGVFLKDPQHKLVNAQKGKTKALRQWHIQKVDIIDKATLLDYVEEAIENGKGGNEVMAKRNTKAIAIDPMLTKALTEPIDFKNTFYG
jgi:uncharacterized protein YdeI (YjbR/CyaY-like superfamily)